MRIAVRRAFTAAALVPVLALSAACSGGDSDGDSGKGKGKDKAGNGGNSAEKDPSASTTDPGTDEEAPASGAALTREQLEKAALTSEDLGKEYKVTDVPPEEEKNGDVLTADKPECQPVADVLSAKPKYKRVATVNRNALKGDFTAESAALVFTYLASYQPGDAEKSFSELKAALGACKSFTVKGQKSPQTVTEEKSPGLGDESLAFTLNDQESGGPMLFNVIRIGTTQAALAGTDLTGGEPTVPVEVATKQADKLQAVSPKG